MPKLMIELDLNLHSHKTLFDQWIAISSDFAAAVDSLRTTRTFTEFLQPLVQEMIPDCEYTAAELGGLFTPNKIPKQISSAVAKIGKTEKRLDQKVLHRRRLTSGATVYSITTEIREAILA